MNQIDIENAAIDYSKEVLPTYVNGNFGKYQVEQAFIDGANWMLKKKQWISVETELPEDGQIVFCLSPFGGYKALYNKYDNVFYEDSTYYVINQVLYWAEIPDIIVPKVK